MSEGTAIPATARLLCASGMLLFVLGLLNGFAIPKLKRPRIALSAHLTAVQTGSFLIATGLLWPAMHLGTWAMALALGLVAGSYCLWLGILAGAIFGNDEAFPIAGNGETGGPTTRTIVAALVGIGALAMLLTLGFATAIWLSR